MFVVLRRAGMALVAALSVAGVAATVGARALDTSSDLYAGLTWRCIGPFDGGPVSSVAGIAGEAGVYIITTPSGGAWKTIDGGDTWASVDQPAAARSADPQQWIDPANPRRIARTDDRGIAVSLDGGQTWIASHHLPIADVARIAPRAHPAESAATHRIIDGQPATVSIADPLRPGLLFAGTSDSVRVSFDAGGHWQPLRLNMPAVRINDLDIQGHNLVAATQGRSVWVLEDISPLRQISAATSTASPMLFRPANAAARRPGSETAADAGANLDYFLPREFAGDVTIEVIDAAGRVVHAATSAARDAGDPWLPVTPLLSAAPGHHRVVWNLRVDPPPAQKHRYAQMARAAFVDMPPDPDGPRVLPGAYRVRLNAGGRISVQSLTVTTTATPAQLAADRRRFDLAMKIHDALRIAHRKFVELTRLRAQLRPMLTSTDEDVARAAADLDARLADLDGSSWTGLVIPDADDEAGEVDEKEGKHPDFVPPKPVSISKDYDDPTSILGRRFANVDHAPALASISAGLGDLLTKVVDGAAAMEPTTVAGYRRSCEQLSDVLSAWTALNRQDLPRLNADLVNRRLPALPTAAGIPSLACGAK